MSEESSGALDVVRHAATPRRPRGKHVEYEILIEDLEPLVPNKYLAVNVAARRARELNDRELPVGELAKTARKPTTQALLELVEGLLAYEHIGGPQPILGLDTDDTETDQDVESIFEEFEEPEDYDVVETEDFDDVDDS
jgi:DNA-directed RNA polymerase omega subunit